MTVRSDASLGEKAAALRLEPEHLQAFLGSLPRDQVSDRLDRLGEWLGRVNAFNQDGFAMTPVLAELLATPGDFEARLSQLDTLRAETRAGRFHTGNAVQRDLEFRRFATEYRKVAPDTPASDVYAQFTQLNELPPLREHDVSLTGQDLAEVKRAAYEAVGLLKFLRAFRSSTSRPIVVVGNDKAQLAGGGYGRQWVVEPLEEHLTDGFSVLYNRVPSHATMRLTVPAAFPKEVVTDMSERMPHVVVVDGASPPKTGHAVRFSKAVRSYANWFAVFNDLRAGEDASGQDGGLLPPDHLAELRKWHEYVSVREQVAGWVALGSTYRLALWSPRPTGSALLGDIRVEWPTEAVEGDTPTVVLANPIVYGAEAGDGAPSFLRETAPYYFDRADRELRARLSRKTGPALTTWGAVDDNPVGPAGALNPALTVFGFGPHGFERRVLGPTFEAFVAEIQRHIKAGIKATLSNA